MALFVTAATLGILAYYFWTRGDDKVTGETDTKGTANRDRRPGRQERGEREKGEGPQVHRQKVETEVRETLQRAGARVEDLLKKDEEKTLVQRHP